MKITNTVSESSNAAYSALKAKKVQKYYKL